MSVLNIAEKVAARGDEIVTSYLKALVNTGLYGATIGEVRERLVCEAIERAIRHGVIPWRYVYIGYERQHARETEVKS